MCQFVLEAQFSRHSPVEHDKNDLSIRGRRIAINSKERVRFTNSNDESGLSPVQNKGPLDPQWMTWNYMQHVYVFC